MAMLFKKEKGAFFEGSNKNYPNVDLPTWMKKSQLEEEYSK